MRFRGQTCAFEPIHSDSCSDIDSSKAGRNQSLDDVLSMTSEVQTSDACEQLSQWKLLDRSFSPPLIPKGFHTAPRHSSSSPSFLPPPVPHRVMIPPLSIGPPLNNSQVDIQQEEKVAEALLKRRPIRIILVRHGQSEGNVDEDVYTRIADSRVQLTSLGFEQAVECGKKIRQLLESEGEGAEEGEKKEWGVYFYVSPYTRTLQVGPHGQGKGRG